MRGKKAKALRTAERPNPGRKHGGSGKVMKTEPVPMAETKKGKKE
jgi:hypothetical protein